MIILFLNRYNLWFPPTNCKHLNLETKIITSLDEFRSCETLQSCKQKNEYLECLMRSRSKEILRGKL